MKTFLRSGFHVQQLRFIGVLFLTFLFGQGFSQKPVPELWGIRVHDDAHALKTETVDQLEKDLKAYEDSTSNQIAILIVQSLDGEVLEEYSLKVAEKWKLGQKGKDNGVLLLVAVDDHKMRIEVGLGLEGVLTDAQSNRIIRNEIAPEFRRGDYDAGINAGVQGIIKAIAGEYSSSDNSDISDLTFFQKVLVTAGLILFISIFAFLALIVPGKAGWGIYLFLFPFYGLFPMAPFDENYWYVPLGIYALGFPLLRMWFVKTAWAKKIASGSRSSSGSSGSSWGGSWSSGSSSWSSFDSGSSFSGGGGSFGGGGSSGSW